MQKLTPREFKRAAPAGLAGDAERPGDKPGDAARGTMRRQLGALRLAFMFYLPIAVLAAAFAGYSWLKATKPKPPKRAQAEKVWAIESVPVRLGDYRPMLKLYGETVAGRQVQLRALVAGEVVKTNAAMREGAVIERGTELLRIDPFDYEGAVTEAKAQLGEAQGRLAEFQASLDADAAVLTFERRQLALAIKDLKRAQPLANRGAVSKKLVDDRALIVTQRRQAVTARENNQRVWKAKIAQQKAVIDRLKWKLRQAERRLAQTSLKAPFGAYVTEVGAEVGKVLSVNDQVAKLVDRGWIEARFVLSDLQYGRLIAGNESLVGRDVSVRWRVGDRPLSYKAVVERVGATIAATSGGVEIYARLRDPLTPQPIRPGAFVEIAMADKLYRDVVRLPATAIYDGNTIYVVENGRLKPRKVKVISTTPDGVLVSGDLKAGDHVMRTRLSAPGEGLKVRETKRG